MNTRNGIISLIFFICLIGAVAGYRYYNYINDDPGFCSMCHLIEEGYNSHDRSPHYEIICQQCHRMSLLEGNRLLLIYYVKGEKGIQQEHGRKAPWEVCLECHGREAAQGSVSVRESYGHARHVFMQNISCRKCHSGYMHSMKVEPSRCLECHSGKLIHGMGTAGLYCLNCHNFRDVTPKMVSSERCFECHRSIPRKGVMSGLECNECHHPHEKLKVESSDCLDCHGSQAKVGQHGFHLTLPTLECIVCHKPHKWEVGPSEAKGLCDRCHPMKDPLSFIY